MLIYLTILALFPLLNASSAKALQRGATLATPLENHPDEQLSESPEDEEPPLRRMQEEAFERGEINWIDAPVLRRCKNSNKYIKQFLEDFLKDPTVVFRLPQVFNENLFDGRSNERLIFAHIRRRTQQSYNGSWIPSICSQPILELYLIEMLHGLKRTREIEVTDFLQPPNYPTDPWRYISEENRKIYLSAMQEISESFFGRTFVERPPLGFYFDSGKRAKFNFSILSPEQRAEIAKILIAALEEIRKTPLLTSSIDCDLTPYVEACAKLPEVSLGDVFLGE